MATRASESAGPEHSREGSNEIVGIASPDAIAVRVYELFEERGREP